MAITFLEGGADDVDVAMDQHARMLRKRAGFSIKRREKKIQSCW